MQKIFLSVIRTYQFFSRHTLPRCRFHPTCSHYTYEAVNLHGSLKGLYLGIKRLSRCHPFNPGGHDPVPKQVKKYTKK